MRFAHTHVNQKAPIKTPRWTAIFLAGGMRIFWPKRQANRSNRTKAAIVEIRVSMLNCLAQYGFDRKTLLHMRVNDARDLQDLWYLRGDLMAAIAAVDGEAVAKKRVDRISDQFKGLVPKGQLSRPSPLGE